MISICKFKLESSDPSVPLAFEAWLDTHCFYSTKHLADQPWVEVQLPNDEQAHQIRFILKNKLPTHTVVDNQGNIISDVCINITDISFDDIKLNYNILQKLRYQHNFNNTQPDIEDNFYGSMGCNGTVFIDFNTPVSIWLLENM